MKLYTDERIAELVGKTRDSIQKLAVKGEIGIEVEGAAGKTRQTRVFTQTDVDYILRTYGEGSKRGPKPQPAKPGARRRKRKPVEKKEPVGVPSITNGQLNPPEGQPHGYQ